MTTKENAINWFEISVTDISRAKKFYESIGFVQISEEYREDGIPHIKMQYGEIQ